ncbi:G-protein coupled receptor 1 [Colletotrichum shisoi]|uniref:G-protein coupled receptor 1 n=1 Tax=Colletotrichum shisoi TaxID=2078593 RepID=A0A5Q4C043_9PEZI|nr:G-protein coupled receptor 1 [Colletotrichum shisoi]
MIRPKEGDEALAVPTILSEVRLQSIVILVVAVMSLAGAGWIMASYAVFPNLRTFRHRLITGLAISDAVMALNFLCSTAMNVGGNGIAAPENTAFCSFNGFVTQVFVIQTDYWVLAIAVCTYFILAGHKTQSTWIQNHELVIWAIPWLFSVLWASIGLGVIGYENIGAWCWFKSDTVRLLVNFIPRWVIIVTMFALYAYLSYVLYKAHTRLSSVQDASPGHPESGITTQEGSRVTSIHEGLARLMLLYPLAYAIIWSLPTAIRIYQATENKPAAFALQTIDKASIVIQGLVDAVIYGVNETTLTSWRARFSRQGYPVTHAMNTRGGTVLAADAVREREWSFRQRVRGSPDDTTAARSTVSAGLEGDGASSSSMEPRDLRA